MIIYKSHLFTSIINLKLFNTVSKRLLLTMTSRRKVVKDAEHLVGYPTSFLSLRWLLSDEVSNVATHIRKLIGTNHPILATAKEFILGERTPTWGLIVLLISKAGGLGKHFSDMDKDTTAGILHSQRVLAEITEMIRTSNLLHTSILNIYEKDIEHYPELNFANSLTLLSGDYLLSRSFLELAILKNQEVNEFVSMSLRDMVEAEFINPRDKQNRPLPCKPNETTMEIIDIPVEFDFKPYKPEEFLGHAKTEWMLRHFWGSGSLLANCCRSALNLAGHSKDFQKLGFLFGKYMALASRAHYDLQTFYDFENGYFSLISAPVLFHLQHDPSFYNEILKGSNDIYDCDYEKIRNVILNHSDGSAIAKTENLKYELKTKSLEVLQQFNESDSKKALENLIAVL